MKIEYSQQWHFDFNPSKSVVMIYGKDVCPESALTLGREVIYVNEFYFQVK
jgi:formate hydrogenlyase subunit 6/NADH:ubiquinone oxidoreductase subunit I